MTIPAAVFQAKCLKLMDEVARTGRPVVITKRGRPAAQLAPVPAALVVEPEFAPHPADDIRRHVCAVNLHRRGNSALATGRFMRKCCCRGSPVAETSRLSCWHR